MPSTRRKFSKKRPAAGDEESGERTPSGSLKRPGKRRKPSRELKKQSVEVSRERTRHKVRKRETPESPTRRRYLAVTAAIVAIVCVALLYPAARTFYESKRIEQRTEAQLQAVNERNAKIQRQNDYLQTDEGIEDQARKEGGYIKSGEEGVVITNGSQNADTTTQLPDQVNLDQIHAPSTWYYDILDAVFFVHV